MTVRPFVPWPDARLRQAAEPVEAVTDDIRAIWEDMIDTMEAMPGYGVGLAAPQIGVMLRLAVVDASDTRGQAVRLANPEIVAASEQLQDHEEASPNIPVVSAKIRRPALVTVAYLDEAGDRVERQFDGLWATSVQHQIDHLEGRVFLDRVKPVKRQMLLRKLEKLGRRRA